MVSPLARRSVVKYLKKAGKCSERRACVVVGLSRSLVRYIARRRRDEAELIKKIHKLAIRNSRYGYRWITVLLRREGWRINKAEYPNHVWSYDFVEDRTERGGKIRILAIIDEYTRECLAIRVAPSIPASAVVESLGEWLHRELQR